MKLDFVDMSAQVYGKYQYCTKAKDGMFYADSDFKNGCGDGPLKHGALPDPHHQDTQELIAKAKAMHEKAMSGWDQWKIFFAGMVVGAILDGFIRLGII